MPCAADQRDLIALMADAANHADSPAIPAEGARHR
jgi:hypothetical protein